MFLLNEHSFRYWPGNGRHRAVESKWLQVRLHLGVRRQLPFWQLIIFRPSTYPLWVRTPEARTEDRQRSYWCARCSRMPSTAQRTDCGTDTSIAG